MIRKNLSFFLIVAIILFVYWDSSKTFFQQDEWNTFAIFYKREAIGGLIYFLKDVVLASGKVHFVPLSELALYLQYKLFGLNFSGYALTSISFHIFNALLVYVFLSLLLKNKYIVFLSTLLFAVNSISSQAVSWIAASLNTQGSTFFSLIFLITFLLYLRKKEKNIKLLIISFTAAVVALLFKETILPFAIFPILYAFYSENKSKSNFLKMLKVFGGIFIFYIIIRIIIFSVSPPQILGGVELLQPSVQSYVVRIIILPFRLITQSLFPQAALIAISNFTMHLAYPQFIASDQAANPYLKESLVLDYVSLGMGALLLFFGYIGYKWHIQKSKKELALSILLGMFIMVAASILIIFIPGKAGFFSIVEPRHLYGGSFGAALYIVLVIYGIFYKFLSSKKTALITSLAVISLAIFNIFVIRSDISNLVEIGKLRKYFLTNIHDAYPKLPQKTVFYIQSDTAYYGMPENEKILPVEVNFGKMLLVWYQAGEKFPSCLYKYIFSINLLSQEYNYCDGRGFGFVRDYSKLKEIIKTNHLSAESIIAYSWSGKNKSFINITNIIRKELF